MHSLIKQILGKGMYTYIKQKKIKDERIIKTQTNGYVEISYLIKHGYIHVIVLNRAKKMFYEY